MKKLNSIFVIVVGIVILFLSSARTITGAAISLGQKAGTSFIGIIFIMGGIASFLAARKSGPIPKENKLEISLTRGFKKATKRVPKKEIENALDKIGTGLGNEEYLKKSGYWSVRTNKGARLIYERLGPSSIRVFDYETASKHDKRKYF